MRDGTPHETQPRPRGRAHARGPRLRYRRGTMPLNIARRLLLNPLLALLLAAALPTQAGTITAFTLARQPYAASQERQFKVYVPDGLSGRRRW
jgi:hypothetical protein